MPRVPDQFTVEVVRASGKSSSLTWKSDEMGRQMSISEALCSVLGLDEVNAEVRALKYFLCQSSGALEVTNPEKRISIVALYAREK